MRPSRRDILRGGVVLGAAAAGGPLFYPSRHAVAAAPIRVAGTTLERTILRNDATANAGGYRLLMAGMGEPHILRTDLKVAVQPGRAGRRVGLIAFAHLTDTHIIDAQSPARVEFTDRYNDAPTTQLIFDSAYRPHEIFSAQLGDAAIRGVRKVRVGPVTGRPLEFALCTGDNIDNAQYNELRQSIAVMDGSVVVPDSGDLTRWEGVHDSEPSTYDVHYWHPDGTPSGALPLAVDDNARRLYGFPTLPGLLDAVRRPFKATGIGMPWYSAFGNHDPLVQGNLRPNPSFNAIAVGGTKVVGMPAGVSPGDIVQGIQRGDPEALAAAFGGPARPVTADPDRRLLTRAEIMAEHFITTGTPVGHGWTQADIAANRAYYAFDRGPLRCVVLDTCHPVGNNSGSIDTDQLAWLQAELVANSRAKGGPRDRLVVVFSHHTIDSMDNELPDPARDERRVLGSEVMAVLLDFPNVILWINGHSHRNTVTPRPRATGGGFWEVNTASHIDFPNQSRLVELVDNRDGTLSVFTTVVDADAELSGRGRIDSPRALASLAREIAANDWQEREAADRRGPVDARNVELIVAAPFAVVPVPPVRRGQDVPVPRPLPATGPEHRTEVVAAALAVAAAGLAAAARREQSGDPADTGP